MRLGLAAGVVLFAAGEALAADTAPAPRVKTAPAPQAKTAPATQARTAPATQASALAQVLIRKILNGVKGDAERALKLRAAAKEAVDDRKLEVALLEEALRYAVRNAAAPEGDEIVKELLDLLAAKAPDRQVLWTAKRIEVYRRRHQQCAGQVQREQAGRWLIAILLADAARCEKEGKWVAAAAAYGEAKVVGASLKTADEELLARRAMHAVNRAQLQEKIDGYLQALRSQPRAAGARAKVVRALLVEMDRPADAGKYLNEALDEEWRTFVPMAAKPVSELKEEECRQVGDWYWKELSSRAPSAAKAKMLSRAKALYERFLSLHGKKDADSLGIKLELAEVRKELSRRCFYCSGTGWMPCENCRNPDRKICGKCMGKGSLQCPQCKGKSSKKCRACKGTGRARRGSEARKKIVATRVTWKACRACKGTGFSFICPECGKRPKGLKGTIACPACGGNGYERCPTCKGTGRLRCTHCDAGRSAPTSRSK